MAIIQISKIMTRSGNLVDLPQLDTGELGWATDANRLFIGKTTPNENVEVLTSYSKIAFSQIDGSIGNLSISAYTATNGQVLSFDGNNWVNRGRGADGLLTLGNVANVKIDGGASGYVLQTDGTGNLAWTPNGVVIAYIENVTKANPAVVTTVGDNYFTDGAQITITNAQGMTDLNGQTYYVNVQTSNTFTLCTNSSLTSNVNSTTYNAYAYTSVTATTGGTNSITVGNSSPLTANAAVVFDGNTAGTGITANTTYYVLSKPDATHLKIATSADGNTSNVVALQTATVSGVAVYQTGGRAVAATGTGTSFSLAQGANTQIQYNSGGSLAGSSAFTFDFANNLMTLNGNANVGNLISNGLVTATRFTSNIATGTAPFVVTSTTQVANLSVAVAGIANTVNDAAQPNITSVGTLTSLKVGNATANTQFGNGTIAATGNANVGNIGAGAGVFTSNITAGNANVTGQLISTVATGTAPFVVTSTTRVSNLNVATSGIANTVNDAAQPNITSVGTLTSLKVGNATANTQFGNGTINTSGNITAGNLLGVLANGTSNVNIPAVNGNVNISATGNANILVVTGNGVNVAGTLNVNSVITGNGNGLSSLQAANVTGTLANSVTSSISNVGNITSGTWSANIIQPAYIATLNQNTTGYAATVTNATQGNITSAANLTTVGNITSGTWSANIIQPAYVATLNQNTTGYAATVTGSVQPNIASAANLAVVGNILAGTWSANIIQPAYIATLNQNTTGYAATVTNATQGNITSAANLTTVGNITSGTWSANVIQPAYVATLNQNTTGYAATVTTNAQPNITSVGTLTSLKVGNATANTQFGNGTINTSGNITAGNLLGVLANGTSNVNIPAVNGNVNISATGNANILVVTGTGANITGTVNVSGNANVGNIGAANGVFTANITANNITVTNTLSAPTISGTTLTTVNTQFTNLRDNFNNLITKFDNDGTLAANSPQNLATQQAIVTYVQNALSTLTLSPVPIGSVFYVAVQTPPSGYLVADGASYSRSTYPVLANALANTYGGNTTNFNVPDLRGQFVRGWDTGAGRDAGRIFGSNQSDATITHNHYYQDAWYMYDAETGQGNGIKDAYGNPVPYDESKNALNVGTNDQDSGDYEFTRLTQTTGNIGNAGFGSETRPTNIALLPIIYSGTPIANGIANITAKIYSLPGQSRSVAWTLQASGYTTTTVNITGPNGFTYTYTLSPYGTYNFYGSQTAIPSGAASGTYTMTITRSYASGYTTESTTITNTLTIL